MKKIIGGGIGFSLGRMVGGVGIAAMGSAFGIPAAVVAVVSAVGGAVIAEKVGNVVNKK